MTVDAARKLVDEARQVRWELLPTDDPGEMQTAATLLLVRAVRDLTRELARTRKADADAEGAAV